MDLWIDGCTFKGVLSAVNPSGPNKDGLFLRPDPSDYPSEPVSRDMKLQRSLLNMNSS